MSQDTPQKKRYAIVGTGSRSLMFRNAILKEYAATCDLVALCDINPLRMQAWQKADGLDLPSYAPEAFEQMIQAHQVDVVIVTTIDRTHHTYLCRAMEAGCDVVTEKPMTVDTEKCAQILETQERTGKKLTVTFNYRYAPRNSKVKELLQSGLIGTVTSLHFEWMLDTQHGADYFRRWHRDKRNSGGLMVHKSTHHFDLVNWWLSSRPETVVAMGDLRFYGRENAEARGEPRSYVRGTNDTRVQRDPFALDLTGNEELKQLYYECESADGYLRDQNVFGDGISIEDDVGVMVRYQNKAVMTYHLVAFAPWEGYRVSFNGTQGRLEIDVTEKSYVSAGEGDHNLSRNVKGGASHQVLEPTSLLYRPHWGEPQKIEIEESNSGGHGGADEILLRDVFGEPQEDPLKRAAGHKDGALSILTGIAANQSMATGLPVNIKQLFPKL
ncbi:Gfo/Idh/MocA family oxidoreductase [Coraliomargarita sp. SDUM461003]|uniref:Gfo/Idh/MocA family oxidoreductase n=1 Tax=Thalassobacterium maritimum TaxID=3041265 RepID=A0ABU1AQR2_9BACT|nr:Gfo/Idh/MocA family oxidoreductase [Coraliomargarita sp. SDUM461003]MDQ8206490.1 Gfo/Idh/MocA family oxidoreductase [Coraliomargarita sp. SDUM461003]